ncbi:MAG: MFS transporter [Actinobacteria bacterium]|nr:MFS transporter [Actinomycetota bacterium]
MEKEEAYGVYRYRWVVLAAFMLIGAITQIMWLNYAPITSKVQTLMHVSEFKVVLLAIMFPLLYIPVSIPAGIIIDRKGFRFAVLLGAILTAGFSFLRLFTGNYPLVLIGMIGIAIGQPFVLNSITKTVAVWFPAEESALATGLATLSLFLGMLLVLPLTPALLGKHPTMNSLRFVVLVYSIVALAGAVLFAIFARAKPPKPPKRTEVDLQSEEAAINWGSLRKIFSLYNFRLLCILILVGNGAFIGILQLLEKILKPKGIGTNTAGNIGAVMVLAGVIGCIVIPSISDKMMRRKPFIILAAGVATVAIFLIGALKGTPLIFVIGGINGFFLFAAFPLVLAFGEETTGKALTGTATAILMLLGNAGGVVITLIMEAIKGATGGTSGSFFWAMMFLVVIFAVGLVFAFFLREEPGKLPTEAA